MNQTGVDSAHHALGTADGGQGFGGALMTLQGLETLCTEDVTTEEHMGQPPRNIHVCTRKE